MSLPCDDGNLIDGDGCSSSCQIEPKFICHSKTGNSSSICIYVGFVYLEKVCVYKVEDNKGKIILALKPYVSNIHKSNFTLTFASAKNCYMTHY